MAYGFQVYEARDRKGGALCAVKMSKREFFSRVDRDRYMREIQSVACLPEHPHVVNYFRGWQQDSHFYIQMELCEAGSLRMLLDSLKQPLDENQVLATAHSSLTQNLLQGDFYSKNNLHGT